MKPEAEYTMRNLCYVCFRCLHSLFSEVPITTYLLLEEISCEFGKFKYGAKKKTGEAQDDINNE